MVYSVWRVAAVAYLMLGATGVLMKMFYPAYAGGSRGAVVAVVLTVASGWWLYKNEIQPMLVSNDHDRGLTSS